LGVRRGDKTPSLLALLSLPNANLCCKANDLSIKGHLRIPYISHGLINYKDTKTKCCHLKKLTCKGTLRQSFKKTEEFVCNLLII
jgi:hypothetical protein